MRVAKREKEEMDEERARMAKRDREEREERKHQKIEGGKQIKDLSMRRRLTVSCYLFN